jgi:hypothetical protein
MKTNKDDLRTFVLSFLTVGLTMIVLCLEGTQLIFAQDQEQEKKSLVEKIHETLKTFQNDAVSQEIAAILDGAKEAEIPDQLLDSFISGVKKIDSLIPKFQTNHPNDIAAAAKELEKIFEELDIKAKLIFAVNAYPQNPTPQQTAWRKTGAARMRNETIATVNALKAAGLRRPANQIDYYRYLCFSDIASLRNALKRMTDNPKFEEKLNTSFTQKKKAAHSDGNNESGRSLYEETGDSMSSSTGSPDSAEGTKEPLKKLTWAEQATMLCFPEINIEQVTPLCELLADSVDAKVAEKRRQMQVKKQQFAPKTSSNLSDGFMTEPYDSSSDVSLSGSSSSNMTTSSNVTVPLSHISENESINLANLLFNDVQVQMSMASHLKQAVFKAKGTQQTMVLKAWCAVSEHIGVTDIYGVVIQLEEQRAEAAKQSKTASGESGDMMMSGGTPTSSYEAETEKKPSLLELVTILSDYNNDPRVLMLAVNKVNTDAALATQLCFNIGGSIQPVIQPLLVSPVVKIESKIALIRALQYIGRPDASDSAGYLIPLLLSNNSAIVEAAADAISEVGDRRAITTLIKGLKNARIVEIIKTILKKMGSTSQNDVITQFQVGDRNLDEICLEILGEGGDINALNALAKVLRRYHNAPSTADMKQEDKTKMLILTMQVGINIISRNMGKKPPELVKKTKPASLSFGGTSTDDVMSSDLLAGTDIMTSSYENSGSTGESGQNSGVADINQLKMKKEEIIDEAPYAWMEMMYIVAAKHLADTVEMMEDVRTAASGKKIGEQIHNERIGLSVLKQTLNTSEEGLTAYLQSKSQIRLLLDQKNRVKRSLSQYQRMLNIISKNKSAYNAFSKALTGVDPNVSTTNTSGAGTETPQTQQRRSLGSGFQ